MIRFFRLILSLLFVTFAFVQCKTKKTVPESDYGNVQVGTMLPDFYCLTSDGSLITRETLVKNPSLIVFFLPCCSDCSGQLDAVESVWRFLCKSGNTDYNFLAISGRNADMSKEYWEKGGYTIPVSFQKDSDIYDKFSSQGFPVVFLTDSGGEVRYVFPQTNQQDGLSLIQYLKSLN